MFLRRERARGTQAIFIDDDHLARLDIPNILCVDQIEGGQCVESPRLPMVDAIRVTLKTGAVRRTISPPPSGDVVVLGVKNGEFD